MSVVCAEQLRPNSCSPCVCTACSFDLHGQALATRRRPSSRTRARSSGFVQPDLSAIYHSKITWIAVHDELVAALSENGLCGVFSAVSGELLAFVVMAACAVLVVASCQLVAHVCGCVCMSRTKPRMKSSTVSSSTASRCLPPCSAATPRAAPASCALDAPELVPCEQVRSGDVQSDSAAKLTSQSIRRPACCRNKHPRLHF